MARGTVAVRGATVPAPHPARYAGHDTWLTRRKDRPASPVLTIRPGLYWLVIRGNASCAQVAAHRYGFAIQTVTAGDTETAEECAVTVLVRDFEDAKRLALWQRAEARDLAAYGSILSTLRVASNAPPSEDEDGRRSRYGTVGVTVWSSK